jgi:Ca2+-binding RTX toxin-like protein
MFQTIRGENGLDFIGTDSADALAVFNEDGTKIVDAKDGDDSVDLFDVTGLNAPDVVRNAVVKLGKGADQFSMGSSAAVSNRLDDSTINGGPGNDNFTTRGAIRVKLRGNEDEDDFELFSSYSDSTINGNSGADSFTITDQINGNGTDSITLINSKILGGSGNDGQMGFAANDNNVATTLLATNSVIQGGKGVDTITIGQLKTGTNDFRVSGGADNDTLIISNNNVFVEGVAYNGGGGDDVITFDANNAGDAITKGGDGNDRISIEDGTADITALGEDGSDIFSLNIMQDVGANAINSTGGNHTITGGGGADQYALESAAGVNQDRSSTTFVINSVSDSPATVSGTEITFDAFTTASVSSNPAGPSFGDVIDLRGGVGEQLVGNRLNETAVDTQFADEATGTEILNVNATSFDAVKTALDTRTPIAGITANLVASSSNVNDAAGLATNTGRIVVQLLKVDAGTALSADGAIDGYYMILNNTNQILDTDDMMLGLSTDFVAGSNVDAAAVTEAMNIAAAIEAGFDL